MAFVPSEPARRIASEHVVVTVHPRSRSEDGAPDQAALRGSVVLDNGRHVSVARDTPIFESDDGTYAIKARIPSDFGELIKGATFSLVVLLPPPGAGYEVEVMEVTRDPSPELFDGDEAPRVASRVVVSWTGEQDPDLAVTYRYIRP